MHRIAMLLALGVLLVAGRPADAQTDSEPTLARSYTFKAKAGHQADFENGMKKQMEWYRSNNETWHWHTWQYETGENGGSYIFRSPGHHWKDLDERSERTTRAAAHFAEVVAPYVESSSASISRVLPFVSRWPEGGPPPAMVSVYEFNIHYGMGDDFVNTMKKIHKAIESVDWDVHYAWVAAVSGTEMPTFWLVFPRYSWSDMQGPEKPFWDMMREAVGAIESEAVRKSLMACVKTMRSRIARFRPELSYMPEPRR